MESLVVVVDKVSSPSDGLEAACRLQQQQLQLYQAQPCRVAQAVAWTSLMDARRCTALEHARLQTLSVSNTRVVESRADSQALHNPAGNSLGRRVLDIAVPARSFQIDVQLLHVDAMSWRWLSACSLLQYVRLSADLSRSQYALSLSKRTLQLFARYTRLLRRNLACPVATKSIIFKTVLLLLLHRSCSYILRVDS